MIIINPASPSAVSGIRMEKTASTRTTHRLDGIRNVWQVLPLNLVCSLPQRTNALPAHALPSNCSTPCCRNHFPSSFGICCSRPGSLFSPPLTATHVKEEERNKQHICTLCFFIWCVSRTRHKHRHCLCGRFHERNSFPPLPLTVKDRIVFSRCREHMLLGKVCGRLSSRHWQHRKEMLVKKGPPNWQRERETGSGVGERFLFCFSRTCCLSLLSASSFGREGQRTVRRPQNLEQRNDLLRQRMGRLSEEA